MAGYKGGMGGGNMQNLMKQAQKMQEQLQETEKLLDDWEIVGTSGGEAVVVYMNAKKIIDGIELDPKAVDPEDVEMLEDLIMAAINDGYKKADEVCSSHRARKNIGNTQEPYFRANAIAENRRRRLSICGLPNLTVRAKKFLQQADWGQTGVCADLSGY